MMSIMLVWDQGLAEGFMVLYIREGQRHTWISIIIPTSLSKLAHDGWAAVNGFGLKLFGINELTREYLRKGATGHWLKEHSHLSPDYQQNNNEWSQYGKNGFK